MGLADLEYHDLLNKAYIKAVSPYRTENSVVHNGLLCIYPVYPINLSPAVPTFPCKHFSSLSSMPWSQALLSCWVRVQCWLRSSWRSSFPNTSQRLQRRVRSARGAAAWLEPTSTLRCQAVMRTLSLCWRTAMCDC